MAKKTQKSGITQKKTTKKVVKSTTQKVTKKKVLKSPVSKVVKKTTKKAPAKKTVKKKAVTKQGATSKTVSKKAPVPKAKTIKKTAASKTSKDAVQTTSGGSAGSLKMVSRSNGQGVSERVAKLRKHLGRGGISNNSRIKIPEVPLTEAQLKKIKSGLARKDLKYFKQLLLEKRAEILGDFAQLAQDVKSTGENVSYEHMADTGTDNFEQEFNLGLMESERALLARINRALARIEDKTYGICVLTGKPINRERLEAKPWAQYSIDVARELDRQGLLDKA